MNPQKILSSITIGAGAIILGLGLQYALANWTSAPTGTPPNNCTTGYPGCDAPINVGASAQAKAGALGVGSTTYIGGDSLEVTGAATIDYALITKGLTIANGTQALGRVLESDRNGVATWVPTSTLGFGGSGGVTQFRGVSPIVVSNSSGVVTISCPTCSTGGTTGGGGTTLDGTFTASSQHDVSNAGRQNYYLGCSAIVGNVNTVGGLECECPNGDTTTNTGVVGSGPWGSTYNYECTY